MMYEDTQHEQTETKKKEVKEHGIRSNSYTQEEKRELIKKAAKRIK